MAEEKQKREIVPVAQGKVRKKSLAEKAGDVLLSEDTRVVKDKVFEDYIIPGIRNFLADVIIGGLEIALFGSSRGRRSGGSHVNYSSYSRRDDRRDSSYRMDRSDRSSRNSYNDIYFDTRGDAEEVLAGMEELVREYHEATVADLYSLAGVTKKQYTDNNWGWTDCRAFHVRRSGSGYMLDFDPPIYLD